MPTTKQKRLVRKISENIGNKGKKSKKMGTMMLESGYTNSTSKNAVQITRSEGFQKLLAKTGITDKSLTIKLQEGLNATKVISCNVIANDGEGMKDANSMTKDFVDVEDFNTRHKYLTTVLELKGLITRSGINLHVGKQETNITAGKIIIVRSPNAKPLKKLETIDIKKSEK